MPRLARIRVHPIKSLDPVERDRVRVSPAGGLEDDRVHAIVDDDGEFVNGKRTDAVHRLRADVVPETGAVRIGERGAEDADRSTFDLPAERAAFADWLSAYFGFDVHVESATGGELTDSRVFGGRVAGVTLVSTATLSTVASWFPNLSVENVRRRFRANLEVSGVPAFWEDRLVGDGGGHLRIDDVRFRGVGPVPRCVVPTRDPDTGEVTEGFRERFVERREATFPDWVDPEDLEQSNVLTVLLHPGEAERGSSIAVGEPVEVLDDT